MKWVLKDIDQAKSLYYQENLHISEELAAIFLNRNIDFESANELIKDAYAIIDNPVDIKNISIAANFLIQILKEKRDIYIFADYDVDGLTSGYIMKSFLQCFKDISVEVYYPQRAEGYGLSISFCEKLIQKYKNKNLKPLIITVDNGITKKEEVRLLRQNNFEALITDHHLVIPESLPEDCIILDAFLGKAGHNLCGAGVAFNLCRYVENVLNLGHNITNMLLYAAAIGTISDVMPLDIYNIALVKVALEIMNSSNCPCNISTFKQLYSINNMTSNTIAWTLAPLLNACSRMGDVYLGADFFYSSDLEDLQDIIIKAKEVNDKRKAIEKEACYDMVSTFKDSTDEILIVNGSEYPKGIHGLIAGKLLSELNKPSIVFQYNKEKNIYVGSSRSNTIELNILADKAKEDNIVESFGGHAFAASFTIAKDKLEKFVEYCNNYILDLKAKGEYKDQNSLATLFIDKELHLSQVKPSIYNEIMKYPYDKNLFIEPIWLFKKLEIVNVTPSKNNKANLKFKFSDGKKDMEIWWWRSSDKFNELGNPRYVDIVAKLTGDFRCPSRITLDILDMKIAKRN